MSHYSDIFSMSTCWCNGKYSDGRDIVRRIKELGFNKLEISYKVSEADVLMIAEEAERGEIEVTSVHAVVPKIEDSGFGTDSAFIGSTDEAERQRAVALVKQSCDWAARLNAGAVVVHPSEPMVVPIKYDYVLEDMIKRGQRDSDEYTAVFAEMMQCRQNGWQGALAALHKSSVELCDYIAQKGYSVSLGYENRMRCYQYMTFDETAELLNTLHDMPVYFWYDIGHGMLNDSIGTLKLEQARPLMSRLLGMHIHGMKDIVYDHKTPYQYSDDVDQFIDFIRAAKYKVLELEREAEGDTIVRGAKMLYDKVMG